MKTVTTILIGVLFTNVVVGVPVIEDTGASPITYDDTFPYRNRADLMDMHEDVYLFISKQIEYALWQIGALCDDTFILREKAELVYRNMRAVDHQTDTVCNLITKHIEDVYRPLTHAIDTCADMGKVGPIASAFIKSLKSAFRYLCTISGEQIFELVHPCGVIDFDLENNACVKEFHKEFQEMSPDQNGTFLEQYCGLLIDNKPCLTNKLQQCQLKITRDTWNGFIDAILSPCLS